MAFNFTGKKVLITGAGQGIGRSLAIALAKCGCQVFAVGRTESKLASLKEGCPGITAITLDIANEGELKEKLDGLEAMDGVVNNAAMHHFPNGLPALNATKEEFDKGMDVNVWAVVQITQICSKKMIEAKKKGSIVNVSSILSTLARNGAMVYCISKAALDMVSKQFALELGPLGIRIYSIRPTLVMTDAIRKPVEDFDGFFNRTPRGHVAEVDEIVQPIMYLLSGYSSAVTGSNHVVDCGLLSTFYINK